MAKNMAAKMIDLSDCEKIILGCVYEYHMKKQEAPNLKDIMEMLETKYDIVWKMQTICTFFTRMEKKGILTIKKKGRFSYYYPVIPYEAHVAKEMYQLCRVYFEGDVKRFKRFVRQEL